MKTRALVAIALMSCGYPQPKDQTGHDGGVTFMDARPDAVVLAISSCDVFAQTGCGTGEKCTWIIDFATPVASLGHAGCAPNGSAAIDAACTRNPPGTTGYDDCAAGGFCFGSETGGPGICKSMCNASGSGSAVACPKTGGPANLGYGCAVYSGMPPGFDVCDPTCDALADNDFMGSGHKSGVGYSSSTGNVCSSTQGCYGVPNPNPPGTSFACSGECASSGSDCPSLVNKSVITGTTYLNGCAQGYLPLLLDAEGSSLVDCIAICKPLDCYGGSCGTGTNGNLIGGAPHQCNNTYARGSFKPSTLGVSGVNGDQCVYSWFFELDQNGKLVRSPTSDVVGFCFDHSRFTYDPTGGSGPQLQDPKCDSLPLSGSGNVAETIGGVPYYTGNAADWGCVSSTTGGITAPGRALAKPHFPRWRMAYRH